MPIYKTINNKSKIGIWKISETLEDLELLIDLNPTDKVSYNQLLTTKRKKEWLATRILIQKISNDATLTITYNKHRKPFLNNNKNLSISHTKDYVAVIINASKNVGIDIQTERKNIQKGAYSFLTAKEIKQIEGNNQLQKTHIYWCAKEALYKYVANSSLNIFTHFSIVPFLFKNKGDVTGTINSSNKNVKMSYLILDEFYLVWTV